MSNEIQIGAINIHNVSKDNIKCKVNQFETFTAITLELGMTSVTLYTTLDDVAAIRRILGGW
jgi:hypothetical protein